MICRQESFVVEADDESEAEEIALDGASGIKNEAIIEHDEEETTKIIVEKYGEGVTS